MREPIFTGSGLERIRTCLGAAVLPHTGSVSDDASKWSAVHAFLEAVNAKGRDAALAEAPDDVRPICEALDTIKLPTDPTKYAAEVAFSLNVVTGEARELGRGIGRRYEVGGDEAAGTCDVVALLDDDAVMVVDWKGGWSKRTAAKDNLQGRFYCLAAARAYGRSRAVFQIIRILEDGTTWTDEAKFDAFDLDSFALDLSVLATEIVEARALYAQGVEPSMVEGAHCRWCPAYARCPAKVALLRATADDLQGLAVPGSITPEVAARAYERLRLYKQAVDRAEEILKDYARANPIPLSDGQVYGVRIDNTKALDGKVAASALRDLLGDAANEAITVEVTQAGIKRALKAAGRPAKDLESILAAIKERGGLRVVQAPKLVAHKPREAA